MTWQYGNVLIIKSNKIHLSITYYNRSPTSGTKMIILTWCKRFRSTRAVDQVEWFTRMSGQGVEFRIFATVQPGIISLHRILRTGSCVRRSVDIHIA